MTEEAREFVTARASRGLSQDGGGEVASRLLDRAMEFYDKAMNEDQGPETTIVNAAVFRALFEVSKAIAPDQSEGSLHSERESE